MATEIDYNDDGSIKMIWLDEDAWPVVDALLAARDERDAKGVTPKATAATEEIA